MKTAYIFHDAFCDQFSDWYPWMKTTLIAMGYLVVIPNFPTPAGQSFESWKAVIKNYIPTFNEETILIGHGTGGVFALRLIEDSPKQIRGVFLVATYAEKIKHVGYDRVNESFTNHTFNWQNIKSHASIIKMFAGTNDPFVPLEVSQHLADNLGIDMSMIPDGGHINKASGFIQAPAIAKGIQESLSELNSSISPLGTDTTEADVQKPTGTAAGIEFADDKVKQFIENSHPKTLPVKDAPASDPKKKVPAPEKVSPNAQTHTMYQDMTVLVNSNKGTVASSLLNKARTDEKIKKENKPSAPNNILYIVGAIIAILITFGIFGLILNKNSQSVSPTAPQQQVQSLIQAENHFKIDIANDASYTLEQSIRNAFSNKVPNGTILDIYYTNGGTRTSFASVLSALGISDIPVSLSGEFDNPLFMHGVGSFSGTISHFLVVPIANYDIAFAGVQEWEPTMYQDLGIFMNVPADFLKTQLYKNSFENEVIANQNIRILRYHAPATVSLEDNTDDSTDQATPDTASPDVSSTSTNTGSGASSAQNPFANISAPYQDGDIMLAYFFLNEKTLIITDNASIIPQILARYAGSQIYGQ